MKVKYNSSIEINSIKDLLILRKIIEENDMEKPNFSLLARELNISRDTVRKHYYQNDDTARKKKCSKIDCFKSIIEELLIDSPKRFNYIYHLYDYLVDKYDDKINFSYNAFRWYIRKHYNNEFKKNRSNITGARFVAEAGSQVQFDFKESLELIDINNNKFKVDIATFALSYSRFAMRLFIPDKTTETVLDFFTRSFESLGGVPKQIVIDNTKALVTTPKNGSVEAVLNDTFIEFCKDFDINVFTCAPYRPESKGGVEIKMKICDKLQNYNGEYTGLESVHKIVNKITANENSKISQATNFPPIMLLDKEKEQFNPLPRKEIRSKYKLVTKTYKVTTDGLFSYKGNRYSVPKDLRSKQIDVRITKEKLQVYYNTVLVCIHTISTNKLNYLEEHYIEAAMLVSKSTTEEQASINFKKLAGISYE